MATIVLDGQRFSLPDAVAGDDKLLVTALKAVAPQIGEKPQIARTTQDGELLVTVVKQAGSKGTGAGAEPTLLPVGRIRTDGGTQARAALNPETVREYREAFQGGAQFPPLAVVYDGTAYWLWDGFHRLEAMHGVGQVAVQVQAGTRRDAVLLAAGANARHGLPRTHEDKRRAVDVLLRDEEWRVWSDGKIAELTHTSQPFVAKRRAEMVAQGVPMPAERQVARGGQTYQLTPPARPAPPPTAPGPAAAEFDFAAAPAPAVPAPAPPRPVAPPVAATPAPPAAAPAPPAVPVPVPVAPPAWAECQVQLTLQILPTGGGSERQVILSGINEATKDTAFALVPLPSCLPWPVPILEALDALHRQYRAHQAPAPPPASES